MNPLILDGKTLKEDIRQQLKEEISHLGVTPLLVIIQVGDREDSNVYIRQKKLFGESIGVDVRVEKYSSDVTEDELISRVEVCNADASVTGIIIQLPLSAHIHAQEIVERVDPEKDVDGLGSVQQGKLYSGDRSVLIPATAQAVRVLCEKHNIALAGKHVLIVGRSYLVGRPLVLCMLAQDATVTVAHSKSVAPHILAQQADIVVVCAGKAKLVDASWFAGGRRPVVIDVGIHKTDTGLCGDVDFDKVAPLVSAISPVPGGVGPLTVACLFSNLVRAFKIQRSML